MQIGKYRVSKKLSFAILGIALSFINHYYVEIPSEAIYTCWVYVCGQGAADIGVKLGQSLVVMADEVIKGAKNNGEK